MKIMLKKIFYIASLFNLIFIFSFHICLSNEQDKTEVIEYDSLSALYQKTDKNSFDMIVFGGLGIASSISDWYRYFGYGPAVSIGLEIPFSLDRYIAIELYGHFWIAKSTRDDGYYQRIYYFDLGDDIYTQGGLSTVIKYCLEEFKFNSNQLSWFAHFGFFVDLKGEYKTLDFGMSLNYKLNDNYSLSLHNRILLGLTLNGEMQQNPNLLMLNICYKFRW